MTNQPSFESRLKSLAGLSPPQLKRRLRCPYCAELILREARICPHCTQALSGSWAEEADPALSPEGQEKAKRSQLVRFILFIFLATLFFSFVFETKK